MIGSATKSSADTFASLRRRMNNYLGSAVDCLGRRTESLPVCQPFKYSTAALLYAIEILLPLTYRAKSHPEEAADFVVSRGVGQALGLYCRRSNTSDDEPKIIRNPPRLLCPLPKPGQHYCVNLRIVYLAYSPYTMI